MKLIAAVVLIQLATLCATQEEPSTSWTSTTTSTLVDQEAADDDLEVAESGSGPSDVDENSEYQWIMKFKNGGLHVANGEEIEDLMECIKHHREDHQPGVTLESQAPTQLEDGPTEIVDDKDKRPKSLPLGASQHPDVAGQTLEEVESTNFYPQYAVGILENNCTAFLIGRRHALTTASCVYTYDDGNWDNDLDFWRGRNGDEYLEKMQWDHVLIPAKFFVTGDHIHNWALITFTDDTGSPVWLKIAHSQKVHDIAMTVYGYLPDDRPWGTMYSSVCRSDHAQEDTKSLAVQCGSDQKFSGGPILKGYDFKRSKMPLVYGISVAYDYSYAHKAVNFHPDLFWSLCHLMEKEGFDPKCGPQQ